MPIRHKPEQKKDFVVRLNHSQHERLTKLADEIGAYSGSGPSCGAPSWRVMIQAIADGDFGVFDKLAGKNRVFLNFKYPPKWWAGDAGGLMAKDAAVAASGHTLKQLIGAGLIEDGDCLRAKWRSWKAKKAKNWYVDDMPLADALTASGKTREELEADGYAIFMGGEEGSLELVMKP